MKLAEVRAALEARHPEGEGEWVVLHEWNRVDTLAVRCYQGKQGPYRIAYETKLSLPDFRRELARPEKRAYAVDVSHYYVFAMPWQLAQQVKHEVPAGLGLVGVLPNGASRSVLKPRRRRDARLLTDAEVSGLVRHRAQPPEVRNALQERFWRNEELRKVRYRNADLQAMLADLLIEQVKVGMELRPTWSTVGVTVMEAPVRRRGKVVVKVVERGLDPAEKDLGYLFDLGYRLYPAEPAPERYAYRPDGWPLCPRCEEDELADLTNLEASPAAELFCYRCQWRGFVPPAPAAEAA